MSSKLNVKIKINKKENNDNVDEDFLKSKDIALQPLNMIFEPEIDYEKVNTKSRHLSLKINKEKKSSRSKKSRKSQKSDTKNPKNLQVIQIKKVLKKEILKILKYIVLI